MPGTDIAVQPVDSATGLAPVTLTFDDVVEAGVTNLVITETGPPPDTGFRMCANKLYFDLATTAVFVDSITVCIQYDSLNCTGNENNLELQHWENGEWVDRTIYPIDTVNDIVCGRVDFLSPFAVFEPLSQLDFDVYPGACPNPFNITWMENIDNGQENEHAVPKKGGVMPAAITGDGGVDVTTIDSSSLRLAGIAPLKSSFEDVTRPADGDGQCTCTSEGPDGVTDLTLKFSRREIASTFGPVQDGDEVTLTITGAFEDGTPFEASDCVTIRKKRPDPKVLFENNDVQLGPAMPNPFNPVTRIAYWLPGRESTRLTIYDVNGRFIERLVDEVRPRGEHYVEWDASGLASGIYFYRLEVGERVLTRKMVLVK
jgi:hypothetical protein